MIKDDVYYFHQTPEELCKQFLKFVPLVEGDTVLEPFRGASLFFNNLPENTVNDWCIHHHRVHVKGGALVRNVPKPVFTRASLDIINTNGLIHQSINGLMHGGSFLSP